MVESLSGNNFSFTKWISIMNSVVTSTLPIM